MKTAKTKTKKNTKKVSKTETKKPSVETKSSDGLEILKIKKSEFVPDNFTGIIELENGDKYWFSKGFHHRLDGPAVERRDRSKEWWVNGKLHREDGPAFEYSNGDKEWYVEDKRHRIDGPACEWADGTKEWWIEGKYYSEEDFKKEIKRRNQETKDKPIEIVSENKVEIINMENGTIVLSILLPKNFPTEIKIDLREIKLEDKTLIIKLEQKDS